MPVDLPWNGERAQEGYTDRVHPVTWAEHIARYEWAKHFAKGKLVLDVASGAGFGARILSTVARAVDGLEIDPTAVAYANERYVASNLHCHQGDATAMPFEDEAFDLAVSFETIEHLDYRKFLSEVARVMAKEGLFIVSTPRINAHPYWRFHTHEFETGEFTSLLGEYFSAVAITGQQLGQVGTVNPWTSDYIIGVCAGPGS